MNFSKASIVASALALFLFVAATESGMIAIRSHSVNVTLCRNDGVDGNQYCKDMPVNIFFNCKNIELYRRESEWNKNVTSIKLDSSPTFGSCIVVYEEENCKGEWHQVNGTGNSIPLASLPMNFSIIKSFELCYTHNLKLEAIKYQSGVLNSNSNTIEA